MVYIADDTLRHQPMGTGHMTVLQLRGPMAFRVLPWWLFIAGDTLRHQPMGASHMTMLQLRGPMAFRVLPWWLFIVGDILRHQPMGASHMTMLQLCRLMEFRALQWCHPMLASTRRTSCCTRMITLYGARKWIQARTTADEISLRVSTAMVHSCLPSVIEQLVQLNPSSAEVQMILRFHVIFSVRFYQNHSRHFKKILFKRKGRQ